MQAVISGMPKNPGLENAPAKLAMGSYRKNIRDTRIVIPRMINAAAALI